MGQCVTLMFENLHNAVWGLEVDALCDFFLSFFGNMVGHYYYFSLFICLLFFALHHVLLPQSYVTVRA